MADKRAFAVFDVGYLDNPKIMDVFDASCIAVCMHFASVLYCAQHLTDGEIALRAMERKCGGTADDSQLLIDAGLWHLPGHDCPTCPDPKPGKAYVHDYLQHNRTSEGVKDKSAAGAKAAKARWEKERADAERIANRNADRIANRNADDAEPQSEKVESAMPRQTEETDRKTSLKDSSSPATPDDDETDPKPVTYPPVFEAFWDAYPRKVGKKAALAAFQKARKTATVQTICTGAARYRDDPNREDAFTAHPTTWLNEGRWDDDPMPDRLASAAAARPTGAQTRAQAGLARLAAYDQAAPSQLELGA